MALLINEFKLRVGEKVPVVIGEPLPAHEISALSGDPKGLMDYLRAETYALSPRRIDDLAYGFEFEDGR
ncbi:MAG: hypothetical protein AAFY59_14765 [Pseudomonadota bacterium]